MNGIICLSGSFVAGIRLWGGNEMNGLKMIFSVQILNFCSGQSGGEGADWSEVGLNELANLLHRFN